MRFVSGIVLSSLTVMAVVPVPVAASEPNNDTIYIRCDDGGARRHDPVGFALNEASNTVAVTEHRMEVAEVTAISFGPEKVTFNVINDKGGKEEFTISRLDAAVSSRAFFRAPPRMPSLAKWGDPFEYSGCAIVKAPEHRAF